MTFRDDLLERVKAHIGCKDESGILGFGSAFHDEVNHSASDIDLLVVEEGSLRFVHHICIIDEINYDIFRMPPEYAFIQLQQRNQFWLHNLAVGKICHEHPALIVLQETANHILTHETPIYSLADMDKTLFFLQEKYKKLNRECRDVIYFESVLVDFLRLLNQHVHLSHGLWPGRGSGKEKLDRLTSQFGSLSELVVALYRTTNMDTRLSILRKIMTFILSERTVIPNHLTIADIDVSEQISDFMTQRKTV